MATINAASLSSADIQSAINSASAGDTVVLPSGTATWSGTVALAKAITLQGQGIANTRITCSASNTITKQAGAVTRIDGIRFYKTGGGTASKAFYLQGSWKSAKPIVFTNCEFETSGSGMFEANTLGIVFSGCNWLVNEASSDNSLLKGAFRERTGGSTAGYADSWLDDDSMGTNDTNGEWNIYVEDCYCYGGSPQAFDFDDGSRAVVRYNTFVLAAVNSHGLDTSDIGCRHFEIYNNDFQYARSGEDLTTDIANVNWLIWIRGGTGIIADNVIDDIAGSYWGSKSEAKFDIRAVQDGSGSSYGDYSDGRAWLSAGYGTYPRQHQLAVNRNSSVGTNGGYFIDPIYLWGNTGSGSNAGGGVKDFANGGSWGSQTGYFTDGTDYYNGGEGAKPGYTKYTYPHPLVSGAGPLAGPQNVRWRPA